MGVGALSDHNRSRSVARVPPRRALPPLVLAVLLLGLLLAGCGRAPTDSPTTAGNSSSSAASNAGDINGGGDNGGGDNGGGNGGGDNGGGTSGEGVAWVPFGPQDPSFPTPTWPVYNAFASGDCSTLASVLPSNDIGDYGELMLAVCQAAVDGQSDKWATAESLSGADPGGLANDCVAPLVQGAVERALAWHRDHPDQAPSVELQETGGQTDCGAQAAADNGDGDEVANDTGGSSDTGDTGVSPSDESPTEDASTSP